MEYLVLVLALIAGVGLGVFIGVFIGVERMKKGVEERSVGYLRVDRSQPDEPPMAFLELAEVSIDAVSRKDYIVLKVVNEDYLARD
jgi:hypothetical protein